MARFAAFLDACILVPIAPCDTLLRLADRGAFRPLWSRKVLDEALRAMERIHPESDPSRFRSRIKSMDEAFDDAVVEGWEGLEAAIDLPDPNDRHVVAAAIRGRADAIITENIKDFPVAILEPLGLEVIGLDDFMLGLYDLSPEGACRVVEQQASAMQRPPVEVHQLLTTLAKCGAPKFATAVAQNLEPRENGD